MQVVYPINELPQAANWHQLLELLSDIITHRLQSYFQQVVSLNTYEHDARWEYLDQCNAFPVPLSFEEKVAVLIALAPHLRPNFFESIILSIVPNGGEFPEFGGVRGLTHRGMLPTGETVLFVLAGADITKRIALQELFAEEHFFNKHDVLSIELVREGEPAMSGRLIIAQEWVERLLTGKIQRPRFGTDFPAKRIHTKMDWNDVVLHPYTLEQIDDIKTWLEFRDVLDSDLNLSRKLKPGYRVLFYGVSGTGKTLTAALLGKEFGKDVYRIDLSQVVSKYIGETEKNLGKVFDKAEHKDWILFFDEADALFGKRTNVQSAHDKFANQEVSFLLQRVEDFSGLLILASNFKNNLDEAFVRRFHAVVHFPMPDTGERLQLWQKAMPTVIKKSEALDLPALARLYEISGASIINVVQHASLRALKRPDKTLCQSDLVEGVRKELRKEEKSF